MRIIFTSLILALSISNAMADDVEANQYIKSKQAHAEALREQATDHVAYLRGGIHGNTPSILSTSAGLDKLAPASGPAPAAVNLPRGADGKLLTAKDLNKVESDEQTSNK